MRCEERVCGGGKQSLGVVGAGADEVGIVGRPLALGAVLAGPCRRGGEPIIRCSRAVFQVGVSGISFRWDSGGVPGWRGVGGLTRSSEDGRAMQAAGERGS